MVLSKMMRWVWWEGKRKESGPEWEGVEEDEERETMRRMERSEMESRMSRVDLGSLKLKDEDGNAGEADAAASEA